MFRIPHSATEATIQYVTQARADPDLEVEVRVGRIDARGRFHAGVTRHRMHGIVHGLDAQATLESTRRWEEVEDFFHDDVQAAVDDGVDGRPATRALALADAPASAGVPGAARLRTRVEFLSDAMRMRCTTIEKTVVASHLVATHAGDLRVSLSRERACARSPEIVQPRYVRIKQQREYHSRESPFMFSCALTWAGETHAAAEANQANDEPCYEIECELALHAAPAYARRHSDRRIARSLLTKGINLLLGTDVVFETA
jgi:hypothetical protein